MIFDSNLVKHRLLPFNRQKKGTKVSKVIANKIGVSASIPQRRMIIKEANECQKNSLIDLRIQSD
jgi:hypothetical protein